MTDDTIRDQHDHTQDEPPEEGIKRRHVLACMAWAGTGHVWTLAGGLPSSQTLGQAAAEQPAARQPARGDFTFVQISDTHIGFKGAANPDVMATLQLAIAKINALQPAPAFLLHTGDLALVPFDVRRVHEQFFWTSRLERVMLLLRGTALSSGGDHDIHPNAMPLL